MLHGGGYKNLQFVPVPSFSMKAADVVREFSDPDNVCGEEDHIVLKLNEPWPSSSASTSSELPKGLLLGNDGHRIITTSHGFVENCERLSELGVVGALFVGCASFESSEQLATAARTILSKAETLVIVHNRDHVLNLVDWFRSVQVLVLHHDIKMHGMQKEWNLAGPSRSRLRRILGSTPALGTHNLLLIPRTICALFNWCPHLCEVQAPMQALLVTSDSLPSFVLPAQRSLSTSRSLILGCGLERLDGMVYASRMETVVEIARFTELTELSLVLGDGCNPFPFCGALETSLKPLRLKYLSLRLIEGVSLTAIANHWPNLETLLITECSLAVDKEQIPAGALRALSTLRMCFIAVTEAALVRAMKSLLDAAAQVVTLRVDGNLLCACFICSCRYHSLRRLEHLTLGTEEPLPVLRLTGDELRILPLALPSLRHVVTDSFDLRLFCQCYLPCVDVHWTQCTTCMAEFPLLDERQGRYWKTMHTGSKQ
ncbi:uncharacterized protein LOC144104561 isoform X2 [Amblyomma americanum]